MTPDEYCKLASRTECDQWAARRRYSGIDLTAEERLLPVRLAHGVIGLTGEVGELASIIIKHLHFGQPLDRVGIKDEIGDCLWYLALILNSVGLSLEEVMESNLRKLRTRYPEKYSDLRASEEGRDREAERKAMVNDNSVDNGPVPLDTYGNPCQLHYSHDWESLRTVVEPVRKCKKCGAVQCY